MKNEVITLGQDHFRLRFDGKVLKGEWHQHDTAAEALRLLEEGYGEVDDHGNITWKPSLGGRRAD